LLTSGQHACAVELCSATPTTFGHHTTTQKGVLRNMDEVPLKGVVE